MAIHHGQCQCGQIQFQVELPEKLSYYQSRACDCDFCLARNIQYLSEPTGKLLLKRQDLDFSQQQGDRQAAFVTCQKCDDVVAATYQNKDQIKGAVNAQLLDDRLQLGESINVSPKLLSAEEKVTRWQALWMTIVTR